MIMDMKKREAQIYQSHMNTATKMNLLADLILDCINELEAQDQNMHPEVEHNLAEALRRATNHLRQLRLKQHH